MKVALLIEKFFTGGGAERACVNLARGLLARGHEVHVFAREMTPLPGIVEHRIHARGIFYHRTFARTSRALVEQDSFHIVQSFSRTTKQDVLRLGGGIHREYLARTEATYGPLGRFWRKIRPKEYFELRLEAESLHPDASKRLIAVSRGVKEEAIRHYAIPADKIDVVYNGVDAGQFKPSEEARGLIRNQLGLADSDYLLLFVGTGARRKGLTYAIRAIDQVPSARLAVVGTGGATKHSRICFLGRRTDVAHFYAAADALILPALYDPFPNAVLEAMASGIPAIVSRASGVSEIIDGDSIVIEEPTDIARLAEAVRRLEDPALRKAMGEAARRKALQFPMERVVDETLRVWANITAPQVFRPGSVDNPQR